VTRVTLIDRGVYEPGNRRAQDIVAADVGRPKVRVMARRLSRIAPGLEIVTMHAAIETVPLGRLRGDAIVAGLDSRLARQAVNEAAFRLGVPWIDAGVAADGLLARVNVFVPGPEAPCLECAWDDRDYAALEIAYPCDPGREPPPTGAPSALGSLAASLAAIELRKLLAGELAHAAVGRQVTVDALHHRCVVTRLPRHSGCRRSDHDPWTIAALASPDRITVGDLAALDDAGPGAVLGVEGRRFERRSVCVGCGAARVRWRVAGTRSECAVCLRCGGALVTPGFDLSDAIELERLGARTRQRTLRGLGIRRGDVVRIACDGRTRRYEVGACA
jgi:adenylyltransferase/sulfurtransferase